MKLIFRNFIDEFIEAMPKKMYGGDCTYFV